MSSSTDLASIVKNGYQGFFIFGREARPVGPAAAAPPARRVGIGVVVAAVGRRHAIGFAGMVSDIVDIFSGRSSDYV